MWNDFDCQIQSDELAACKDYAEWQDLREQEAIAMMEREQEEEDCCCFCGVGLTDSELHRGHCSQCD